MAVRPLHIQRPGAAAPAPLADGSYTIKKSPIARTFVPPVKFCELQCTWGRISLVVLRLGRRQKPVSVLKQNIARGFKRQMLCLSMTISSKISPLCGGVQVLNNMRISVGLRSTEIMMQRRWKPSQGEFRDLWAWNKKMLSQRDCWCPSMFLVDFHISLCTGVCFSEVETNKTLGFPKNLGCCFPRVVLFWKCH